MCFGRRAILFFLTCCVALAASGITLELRDGTMVSGEIVRTDDRTITMATEGGEATIPWPKLTNRSIKEADPAFYRELVRAAKERREEMERRKEQAMREKGLVKYEGEWMTPEDMKHMKYKFITLHVETGETRPSFKTSWKSSKHASRETERECCGTIKLKIFGCEPDVTHDLRVEYTHYTQERTESTSRHDNTYRGEVSQDRGTFEGDLKGMREYRVTVESEPYTQKKYDSNDEYEWFSGKESKGFDVKVYLNGDKVYEKLRGKTAAYWYVTKM